MLFPISPTQFLCEEGSVIITVALVIGSSLPCQLLEGRDGVCFVPFDPQNLVPGQECQTAVVLVGLTLNSWLNGNIVSKDQCKEKCQLLLKRMLWAWNFMELILVQPRKPVVVSGNVSQAK